MWPCAKSHISSHLTVALNYQTPDKPNQYNRALFTINGNCGYVLKPRFLRDAALKYNPTTSNLEEIRFPPWDLTVQGSTALFGSSSWSWTSFIQ